MVEASFFTRFGFFVTRGFLEPHVCAELRREMRTVDQVPATVRDGSDRYTVDDSVRKVKWAMVSAATSAMIEDRLHRLRPNVADHFDLPLTGHQSPQFLVYQPGAHYLPHSDRPNDPSTASSTRERQITVLLFLNEATEQPTEDGFGGGTLSFFGLLSNERTKSLGLPLDAETGTLVAFRPALVHAVSPVTHGERYSIASWYT